MSKGKAPQIRAAIVQNWSMFEVENVKFVLLSKSHLCASVKEKLKVLDTKAKEVYGNDCKACMVMKDRDKLFLEAQIELENNVAKVAIEEEKAYSLKAKMDKLLHDRLDSLIARYIEDELKLIDNQN